MVVQPRLASTVMLLRESNDDAGIEVFMVRRTVQSEFMPNVYVFPGGSVTTDDRAVEELPGLCTPIRHSPADPEQRTALGQGIRAAAIRELFEEANVLLAYQAHQILSIDQQNIARFAAYRQAFHERRGSFTEMAKAEQLTLATDQLAYFAHWITPLGMPKRYDTHFFLAAAPTQQEALYDRLETSDGIWIRPAEALARFAQKTFAIAFPTYHQLQDLATFANLQEAFEKASTRSIPTRLPILTDINGVPHVYLPDDPDNKWNTQQ